MPGMTGGGMEMSSSGMSGMTSGGMGVSRSTAMPGLSTEPQNQAPDVNEGVIGPQTTAEQLMIRYLDFTVQPDKVYQYRIRVVVRNPNHFGEYHRSDVVPGAADEEYLAGDWSAPTPPVLVAPDAQLYATQFQKGAGRSSTSGEGDSLRPGKTNMVQVQVHRWVQKLGDWVVATFENVVPGQFIGSKTDVSVVDFTDKVETKTEDFRTDSLVLDVLGGSESIFLGSSGNGAVRADEEIPKELLITNEYGDIQVRSIAADAKDKTRKDREEYYKSLVADAKKGQNKEAMGDSDVMAAPEMPEAPKGKAKSKRSTRSSS